jgi:hypothetical protein
MVPSKYNRRTPTLNIKIFIDGELRNVELSINSIVEILKAIDQTIQIGPNDSGGVGFRVLRIPN